MRMVKSLIEKKGNKAVFKAAWKNHMRQPKALKIVVEDAYDLDPTIVCETEDPAQLHRMLCSFAELAWQQGWRPRNLVPAIAGFVQAYKEPPAERKD